MGSCYSDDYFFRDRINLDITCNPEEPQRKYRLGTVSNRLLVGGRGGVLGFTLVLLCFCRDQKH